MRFTNNGEDRTCFVYLLRCCDGTLYCGWTNDLSARLKTHNSGQGAKYTRARLPVELVYFEEYDNKCDAMSREWHIKRLSKKEKEELVKKFKLTKETDI